MPGDLEEYKPGTGGLPATVVADSNGNVAQRGDLVEIVGENRDLTEVRRVTTSGTAVPGHLSRTPDAFDPDATYSAGEEVGESTVLVKNKVDRFKDGGNAISAGDQVVAESGGSVRTYNTGTGDTADMIQGLVWSTSTDDDFTSGTAAVIRE